MTGSESSKASSESGRVSRHGNRWLGERMRERERQESRTPQNFPPARRWSWVRPRLAAATPHRPESASLVSDRCHCVVCDPQRDTSDSRSDHQQCICFRLLCLFSFLQEDFRIARLLTSLNNGRLRTVSVPLPPSPVWLGTYPLDQGSFRGLGPDDSCQKDVTQSPRETGNTDLSALLSGGLAVLCRGQRIAYP
ncbi:hypothetical protein LZ30DRAFT_45364 [Colletotrichum cereale]|nr:hypothetical protein LZ30DRAFT_45364 [Colletotrichum cereale]